jgi:nitrogen regulatory protein PII
MLDRIKLDIFLTGNVYIIMFLYFTSTIYKMAKDNSNLPFEVRYAEMPGKEPPGKKSSMKRLAVLVKPENVGDIISSLKGLEATIYDVKGVSKDKERVASGRGSGTVELAYNTRKVIATVVNSDDVKEVVGKMKKALDGNKAVVMISSVDDLVMV